MTGLDSDASPRRPITDAQWLAARKLSEGGPPLRTTVAGVLGCHVSALHARAAAEGWRLVDFRGPTMMNAWAAFMDIANETAEMRGTAREGPSAFDPAEIWPEEGEEAGKTEAPDVPVAADAPSRPADASDAAEAPEADDPRAMLSRGARFLSRRLLRLMRAAERGGAISKYEIDNLTALARMMDRWEAHAKAQATHEENDRDDRIAEALRKIDRRILTLAREEAERMVGARGREGDRGRDQ